MAEQLGGEDCVNPRANNDSKCIKRYAVLDGVLVLLCMYSLNIVYRIVLHYMI